MNLKRAVEIIDGGAWITGLRYITADVNKGKGGQVIEFRKCRLVKKQINSKSASGSSEGVRGVRNPNHHLHFTRNMMLPNNQIRKVHPILITHLNQEEVI